MQEITKFEDADGQVTYRFWRGGNGWALIYLGPRGEFTAQSDYGNFAYWWSHVGGNEAKPYIERFLEFLSRERFDTHYFTGKLAAGRKVFDGDRAAQLVRERLLDLRKSGGITREMARHEWDQLDDYGFENEFSFAEWLHETSLEDAYEFACYSPDPQACFFVDRIMEKWLAPLIRTSLLAEEPHGQRI